MYIVHCLSESNCAGMYSVHGRVTVDNMCEFQHSSSRADCTFDVRFASQTRKKARLPTQKRSSFREATITARVQSQPGPEKASALSLCHPSRVTGLQKLFAKWGDQSSRNFVLLVVLALLLALALPLLCSLPS